MIYRNEINCYFIRNYTIIKDSKPTWTKHADGRSNTFKHSPVATFHNTTFGEKEFIFPVREQVAAITILFCDFFNPVGSGFCSMLTQLIG